MATETDFVFCFASAVPTKKRKKTQRKKNVRVNVYRLQKGFFDRVKIFRGIKTKHTAHYFVSWLHSQ